MKEDTHRLVILSLFSLKGVLTLLKLAPLKRGMRLKLIAMAMAVVMLVAVVMVVAVTLVPALLLEFVGDGPRACNTCRLALQGRTVK